MAFLLHGDKLLIPTPDGEIRLTLKRGQVRIERFHYDSDRTTTIIVPLDAFKELEKAQVLK